MGHKIEGNPTVGFRVIDDEAGALSGRKATEAAALEAAGLTAKAVEEPKAEPKPRRARTKASKD